MFARRKGNNLMTIWELIIIAIGLSMDAFAVAVCKGLAVRKVDYKHSAIVGAYFGGFQAFMPIIGFLVGMQFQEMITAIDHWIAFVLLLIIGSNMIKESRGEDESLDDSFSFKAMFPLAIATSIDALAIGVTFAFLKVNIVWAVSLIGVITFILSGIGVKVGNNFGIKYKSKAEMLGGIVLILLGTKILIDHIGLFNV